MIGKAVSHYKILEPIGGGGMGFVYKAQDLTLDRLVALKFLPPELTRDPLAKQRFLEEAKAASALDHPNICTVHDVGETDDGQFFIVMAYYDGETLKEKIERRSLSIEQALDFAIQIAHGLAKAHEHGIIHRDIKPANVIVTADGLAKILDFGLAKLGGRTTLTQAGATLGTVAYMSPEQARGETVDERVDLWALGVILYESVAGVRPFRSEYEQALVYSILNEDPTPPTQLNSSIPENLEAIILHSLAKDPDGRFQHADEFARSLEELRPPGASDKTTRHRLLTRWLRSPRALALALFAMVCGVAGVLLLVPSQALPFTERDWIVVADFENTTGEGGLDKALNTALTVSIGQSNYVNVVPRRRLEDALRRMKRSGDKPIDGPTAHEIALREGLSLVVVPSINKVGTTYALTWKVEDSRDGSTLASGVVQAEGADEILPSLDEMCKTIRRTLGESHVSIFRHGMDLTHVTTSSLDALKEYSLGIECHWKMDFERARLHYAAALRLDTTFTAARASLGMLCYERFDTAEGRRLLAHAVNELDGVTEKERYGILSFHARAVEGSLDNAIRYLKGLLDLYPDYGPAHNNLGWYYFQRGQYDNAVEHYKEAIRCDPSLSLTYGGLEWTYLYCTGDIDSTILWCNRHIMRDSSQVYAYDNLGYAYAAFDSLEQALAAFRRATELDPTYIVSLFRLSDTYRLLGRYTEAIAPLERITTLSKDEGWALYELGLLHRLMGNEEAARKSLGLYRTDIEAETKANPKDAKSLLELAKVYVRLGQPARGAQLAAEGIGMDTSMHFELAQFKAAEGKNKEVVDQLELAIQGGFRNYPWIRLHPDFHSLQDEPPYEQLLRRVTRQ